MRTIRIVIFSGLVGLAACGNRDERTTEDLRDRCAQLRDHLIDLDVEHVTVDRDAHREALARALGDHFVDDCAERRSAAAVTCGLTAGSLEVAARCEGSRATAEVTP
jgi:hypothetical protein